MNINSFVPQNITTLTYKFGYITVILVRLEEEVAETRHELVETRQEVAERTQEVAETRHQMERTSQEYQQALQQAREENKMLRRLLQREIQRVGKLEQNSDQELQRQARRAKCKVCLDEEVQISFLPCGHLVTCEGCANHLHQCPTCRKNIKVKNWVLLA